MEPSRELFKNIPESPLSFEQFKDFIENAQGGTDLDSLCIEYQSSPEAIIKIIETIRPVLTAKSIKNRLTRLSNALYESENFNDSQASNLDWNEDETY